MLTASSMCISSVVDCLLACRAIYIIIIGQLFTITTT